MAPNPSSRGEDQAKVLDVETGEITEAKAVGMIAQAFGDSGVAIKVDTDPEEVQQAIVRRVLSAESIDELFEQWEVTKSNQLEGRSFDITGVEFAVYNADSGPVPLARVEAVDLATEKATPFVTTAPNLTAFLYKAQQLGSLPFKAKIVGAKTARGYMALHFERA